jgi:hypothetical protein
MDTAEVYSIWAHMAIILMWHRRPKGYQFSGILGGPALHHINAGSTFCLSKTEIALPRRWDFEHNGYGGEAIPGL